MLSLILHGLRKAKGQFVSFGIVMVITALILNTSLVLLNQTSTAYDRLYEDLGTAELSVAVPEAMTGGELRDSISAINGTEELDEHEALFAAAALQEFQGSEFTMNTFFYRLSDERVLNRHELSDETDGDAYIPLYLSELGGYAPGGTIRYIIDGTEHSFTVAGVISEMQFGNYGTGFIGLYLTDEAYEELSQDSALTPVHEYLLKLSDGTDVGAARKDLSRVLKDKGVPSVALLDCDTAKGSRTMVANTVVLFLAAFAALVLIVSIFLARFRIKNTIDEEIDQMGVLKGVGYTSRQLTVSQVVPYCLVSGAGLLAGTGLSYLLIPIVARILAIQSGFSYEPVFDILAAAVTVAAPLLAVFIFTVLAAGKIKRLQPINAIRGIDPLKPIRKDRFPLDKGAGSIGLSLILKQTAAAPGRSLLLMAVTFVMMMILSFTGALLYNVNIRPDNFLTTISEELPDITVKTDEEHFDRLRETLSEQNVKNVSYGTVMAEYADGSLPVIVCEDFSLLENDISYEGSHPAAAGEIALGSEFRVAYAIGDSFTLTLNGRGQSYRVTGFIQSVNNNGTIAEVTDQGYREISDEALCTLSLYLDSREETDRWVERLEGEYGDLTVTVTNAAKETESMKVMYSSLITVVAILLFIITVLIVLLILYVILRSAITQQRTEFGIMKAMGFTSRQLTFQTVGSLTPVVLIGSLLSGILGLAYLPVMFGGIFTVIGAMKNNFETPIAMLLLMALVMTLVNILLGAVLCRPIRKITAYSLIKE